MRITIGNKFGAAIGCFFEWPAASVRVRGATLLAMALGVALLQVTPDAVASPCGSDGERACCADFAGKKDTERNMRSRNKALNDCEKELFAIPGCSKNNKSGTCKCDNSAFEAITTCRSAKWVVDNVKGSTRELREILADAKDVVEREAEAAARKLEEETKKAAADFKRDATNLAIETKRFGDVVAGELTKTFEGVKAEAACRAVLGAVRAGRTPGPSLPGGEFMSAGLERAINEAARRVPATKLAQREYRAAVANVKQPYEAVKANMRKFQATMMQQNKAIADAFSPDILCVPSQLERKLKAMAKPPIDGRFFTSQALSVGASAVSGVQLSIAYVYNWDMVNPEYGVFLSVGPVLAPATVGVGGTYGIQFFPAARFSDFSGLGYSISASGGTPNVEASVGVDLSYPFPFDPWKPLPTGFGFNLGAGLNAIPTPVEGSTGVSQTWKLWSYPPR